MPKTTSFDVSARYVELKVTTAAKTATKSTAWNIGQAILEELQVLWSPGHVALTGIRLMVGNVALLPWNQPTTFLVGDNERRVFEVNYHVTNPLTIVTQNNDTFAHTHYFVAMLRDVPLASDVPRPVVPIVS